VGMAVYTGKETKIQMNMTEPPVKVSNIERRLNTYIIGIFFTLFILCCAGAIAASINMVDPMFIDAWYMAPGSYSAMSTYQPGNPGAAGTFSWFAHLILLSLLVPISLYVTVEMVKLMISILIQNDREMYAVEEDQVSLARSMGLCEELGQVNYIFSDKTGTLTQNLMEFKKCSIAGAEYGRGFCEVERAIARRQGRSLPNDPLPPEGLDRGFNFVDERLLFGNWLTSEDSTVIEDFLVNMALNHNVQVEYSKTGECTFQAESPDEGAFVTAARNMGFFFSKREIKDVLIKIAPPNAPVGDGPVRRYVIQQWMPFDNNRKRTSVIVKTEEGALMLLVKGADASVMPFIDKRACPFFKHTQDHIDKFGNQGLRTLVFAGRKLDTAKYQQWNELYKKAALMADGREAALRYWFD
jgi:phospholipid-translocating ATPase